MSKGKKVTVGYRYYLGVQLAVCHGPVDAITELVVGERQAWSGNITDNGSVSVDAEDLFGGEKSQGGVSGTMTITMGDQAAQDPYLVTHCGSRVPAYIGLTTAIFKSFYWSAMNPYFKAPWLRVRRILKGWARGNQVWYPAKAVIGGRDMNPAHIVYQCLTDTEWGMGYNPTDIGTSFTSAADTLYTENFGLSLIWDQQMALSDFIGVILNHINATLYLDLSTGLFEIKLIRDNYNPATVDELNPSNVLKLESFERAGFGDLANQLTLKYTDRDQIEQTVTVQDLASIEAQGAIINTSREYLGIRTPELAMRVAQRDLTTISTPLAKVTLQVNRVMWNKVEGDVFALTWPKLGLTRVIFRIVKIAKGTLTDGAIRVEAVEDVFGMPASTYTNPQPPIWTDPLQPPQAIVDQRVIEAPYWEIVRAIPEDLIPSLTPGYAYALFYAARRSGMDIGFEIYSGASAAAVQATGVTGTFEVVGTLVNALDKTTNTVTLSGSLDFSLLSVGDYGYIDNEAMSITAINANAYTLTVTRAVLDTVPEAHTAGTKCYFTSGATSTDDEQRLSGETTHYKLLTRNGLGTLPLASATSTSLTFVGRAERPFPPGRIRFTGTGSPTTETAWPSSVNGNLSVTWAHRNRVTQTAVFVGQDAGSISPEAGTTYNVRLYRVSDNSIIDQITGFTGTSFTSTVASSGAARIEIESARDSLLSWQKQTHTFNWTNAGPVDPNFSLVALLMHMNGADGSTTFVDVKGNTVTPSGNAQISTAQSKFGGASLYLDGTGDFLSVPNSAAWNLSGANPYTVEMQIFIPSSATAKVTALLSRRNASSTPGGWQFGVDASDKLYMWAWGSSTQRINLTSTATIPRDQWVYVGFTSTGGSTSDTITLFVGGAVSGSASPSGTLTDASEALAIGRDRTSTARDFHGYIDELRITDGIVRSVSSPPTAQFPDA